MTEAGSRGIEVRVDVTDATGTDEPLSVAGTVLLPDVPTSGTVVFGYPGGGYNRRYWNLRIPGHDGYSQADYHRQQGHVFVACDHLGVGDSDEPVRPLEYDAVARENSLAAREILARLREGRLAAGVAPVEVDTAAALGQSFGGFLVLIAQGAEPVFDGIGILGYNARDPQTPWPAYLSLDDVLNLRAGNGLDHPLCRWFHYADVPEAIVLADMTKLPGTLDSGADWSSPNNPGGPAIAPTRRPRDPGVVAADAAAIEVPVLIACGEVDVVLDPRLEPTAFPTSAHITTAVIARMGHMHNFASSRARLWQAVDDWLIAVARETAHVVQRA